MNAPPAPRSRLYILALSALTALSMFPLGSASATPSGAVVYDGGDPIGSANTYGGFPLAYYTSETGDDDWWGLDSSGLPANDDGSFDSIDHGIPIGFDVNFYGQTYDEVYVGSNGTICFVNDCSSYDESVEDTFSGSAGFAAMAIDSDPSEESWTGVACDFGGFHQEFGGSDYCSSVFWGQATVDGADAFVVTYHHLPSYSPDDSDDWNTLQIILVDRGSGDFETWFNYDRFVNDHEGYNACDAEDHVAVGYAYDAGGGVDSDYYDFFGAACEGGVDPTPLVDLVDGGASALVDGNRNSAVAGRYILFMAGGETYDDPGEVPDPTPDPEPEPEPQPDPEPEPQPEIEVKPNGGFDDVAGDPFADDIAWVESRAITSGCNPPDNTMFCPNAPLTREQTAAFLNRALGFAPTDVDYFVDDSASVFETDLNEAAAAGVFRGCNPPAGDMVCPGTVISRGEFAAVLVRAWGLETSTPASFVDTAGSVFETDIAILGGLGVTRGCNPPDGDMFCPDLPITRGQAAAFIRRTMALD